MVHETIFGYGAVLCLVLGCSKRSGRDKDVSFYRIPKVITTRGKQEYELTKKRRGGFISAISRDGLKEYNTGE